MCPPNLTIFQLCEINNKLNEVPEDVREDVKLFPKLLYLFSDSPIKDSLLRSFDVQCKKIPSKKQEANSNHKTSQMKKLNITTTVSEESKKSSKAQTENSSAPKEKFVDTMSPIPDNLAKKFSYLTK